MKININYVVGHNLYAVMQNESGYIYNKINQSFVNPATASATECALDVTEVGNTHYYHTFVGSQRPLPAGSYLCSFYHREGSNPAFTDPKINAVGVYWDGFKEIGSKPINKSVLAS